MKQQRLRLPRISNQEYEEINRQVHLSGLKLDECPTCHSREVEIAPGVKGRESGTYSYRGEVYECDCETQITLYRHYLLAGIGDQYMRLNWADFNGSEDAKIVVEAFRNDWQNLKTNGMGAEFFSKVQGTGKTFAATTIGKDLVKRGERVKFITFVDVISSYQRADADEFDDTLRNIPWLILDEVIKPWTGPMSDLYSTRLEALVRYRQNYNRPVIMTTNLTPDELREHYERTYSLLEAKQWRVEMTGEDARMSRISLENRELVENDEVRPIV